MSTEGQKLDFPSLSIYMMDGYYTGMFISVHKAYEVFRIAKLATPCPIV